MSQDFDYSAPDVNNQYQQDISEINNNLVALMTAHSGNTQPSGLSAGALWLDTSNVPYTLKQLDSNGNWVDQPLLTERGRDVDNARGTRDTLDQRISESLNDDGSLKTNVSANISQFIDFAESGTNAVDTNTFEVDGDHVDLFYPNSERGRIAKVEQPNEPTTVGPVSTSTYNSGTNTTTVNLIESKLTDTLNSGIAIDDIHYGTVDSSDQGGLPLIPNDKLESGPKVNYLDPDGLVISNNSTDSDHDIDVDGGRVWVNDDSGGTFQADSSSGQVVELSDESPAFSIDSTGDNGLINSSSLSTNTWYELGVIYDSTNDTVSVAGWTDGNRPTTVSDLPSDFDHLRAMGTPGKTWWVRTDGSSNIYEFNHDPRSNMVWTQATRASFSRLLNTGTPATSSTSIDISSQAPPIKINSTFTSGKIDSDGSQAFFEIDSELANDANTSQAVLETGADASNREASQFSIFNIQNQDIFYRAGNASSAEIRKVLSFRAVN